MVPSLKNPPFDLAFGPILFYPQASRRFRRSLELQIMQRQFFGFSEFHRNYKLHVQTPGTMYRGGAEGYCWFRQGRMGQVGTKEREEGESDLGFHPRNLRRSCDRRGKLDVEDCSSECLYVCGSYEGST